MSNLLRRAMTAVKSSLSGLLESAEDPREAFADAYERQRQLLVQVRAAIGENTRSQERLALRARQLEQRLLQFTASARQSVLASREDLARLALQQSQGVRLEWRALELQVQELQGEGQRLTMIEQRLISQAESFQTREAMLEARSNAAEAHLRVTEALSGASTELADLGLALEQATQKTEHLQARAATLDSLIADGVLEGAALNLPDPLLSPLLQAEAGQSVDDQLAQIKLQLGM